MVRRETTGRWRRRFGALAVLVALASAWPGPAAATPATPTTPAAGAPSAPAPASGGSQALLERARQGRVVPPALDDVEQVCALLTSCDHLPIPASMTPTDFGACVRSLAAQLSSPQGLTASLLVRECGLRANSCAELRACGLRGASAQACAGRGKDNPAGYCDIDGRALQCVHERVAAVRDCPRGGEQCSVREGEAACSLGPCPAGITEGAPAVCSASGTRILRCEHGVLTSLDCAAFGLTCASGGSAEPACAPPTAPCTAGRRCEGDVAVGCVSGHEARVDCGAAGMTCSATDVAGRSVGACVTKGPPPTCDASAPARCDGARVRYCGGGHPRSFLCRTLGFSRCVSDSGGARCG